MFTHSDQICSSVGFLCVFMLQDDNKGLVKRANARLAQQRCFTYAGTKERELVAAKVSS